MLIGITLLYYKSYQMCMCVSTSWNGNFFNIIIIYLFLVFYLNLYQIQFANYWYCNPLFSSFKPYEYHRFFTYYQSILRKNMCNQVTVYVVTRLPFCQFLWAFKRKIGASNPGKNVNENISDIKITLITRVCYSL